VKIAENFFQGQKSKVKVRSGPNALFRLKDDHRLTVGRPLSVRRRHRSTVWRRGWRVV